MAGKTKTSVLRYPTERIESSTDYLSISIYKYNAPGLELGFTTTLNETSSDDEESSPINVNKNNKQIAVGTASKGELKGRIYLPIPQNISDTNSAGWGEDSLNTFAAYGAGKITEVMINTNLFKGMGQAISDVASDFGGSTGELRSMVNPFFASKAVNLLGAQTSFAGLLARSEGRIVNPNKELLFNGVKLRSFNFSFDLAPRDSNESIQIKKIIRCLKQNMMPKVSSGSKIKGLFLDTPNIFQLEYKTGSSSHKFLNKFKLAALVNMNLNYTGSGTYMTYNDDDKTPVHMKLDLSFQELVPVYASDYDEAQEGVGY